MIDLQTAYNIASVLGFVICMYKINKLENIVVILQANAVVATLTIMALNKTLKNKDIIQDSDLDIESEIKKFNNEY